MARREYRTSRQTFPQLLTPSTGRDASNISFRRDATDRRPGTPVTAALMGDPPPGRAAPPPPPPRLDADALPTLEDIRNWHRRR